jgi:hypothetical protein
MMNDGMNDSRTEMGLPRALGRADIFVCMGKAMAGVVNAVKCGPRQQQTVVLVVVGMRQFDGI